MLRILAYSVLSALRNESLWTRASEPSSIRDEGYYSGDFPELVSDFYRMEYTYSMLKTRPFSGVAKRKEAILQQVQNTFEEVSEELLEVFVVVFASWLEKHAITEPALWAERRVEDDEDGEGFIYEYARYRWGQHYPPHMHVLWQTLEKEIVREHPEDLSAKILDALGISHEDFIEEKLQSLLADYKYDPEEVLSQYDLSEEDGENIEEVLRAKLEEEETETSPSEYLSLLLDGGDLSERIDNLGYGNKGALLCILYEELVFPKWMEYWGPRGLQETRDNVESAYLRLRKARTLEERSAAINHATNVSHQNGSMLEYVEEVTGEDAAPIFEEMSEGNFTSDIDPILKAIGVQL